MGVAVNARLQMCSGGSEAPAAAPAHARTARETITTATPLAGRGLGDAFDDAGRARRDALRGGVAFLVQSGRFVTIR